MSSSRPRRLVLVVGTGTEVGKTWVSVQLLRRWRAGGRSVAARKPAQSFEADVLRTDADLLGAASGEQATTVCPPHRWYAEPMAPPMAAELLGRPALLLADLVGGLVWPSPQVDVGLVETAGGVRSPQAEDGDVIDLAGVLAPDAVVLVADAGLGTVNAVRLTTDALAPVLRAGATLTVVLNRYDPDVELHRRNRSWLAEHEQVATAAGHRGLDEAAATLASTLA